MKKEISKNRRGFLKKSVTGALGAFAIGKSISAAENNITDVSEQGETIYRTLGRTGIKVPIVSSGKIPEGNDNLAQAILKSGIKHIDTAFRYGDGKNEAELGKQIKNFNREDFVIATKMNPEQDRETGLLKEDADLDAFRGQIDTSLERLGTNYVDILYIHSLSTREAVLDERHLNILKEQKKLGKAKSIGVSTHSNVPEVIHAAIEAKVYDVVLIATNFAHNQADEIKEAVRAANEAGLGVVAMKVLAGIYDTKIEPEPVDKNAALKWVMQNPDYHTAIMTIRTFDDLENYLSVMTDVIPTEEELKGLTKFKETASLFCSGCKKCIPQCPYNIEIPDYMRAYMYAYGYRNAHQSKELVDRLSNISEACSQCKICTVTCPSGLAVKDRITDIHRLKEVPGDLLV